MSKRDIEPIDESIRPRKAQAWHYRVHPYFTKQSSNVVAKYIKHFSRKGDTVLDPFCGTGVTAVEALSNGRKAVMVDIAPLATFLTRQTCGAPVDIAMFNECFKQVEQEMKDVVKFTRRASHSALERYDIKKWYPKGVRLPSNADCELVEDLFTKRNLIVLSHLLAAIKKSKDDIIRSQMLLAFSGILHRASRTYFIDRKHAGGGNSGIFTKYRYWIPPVPDERDVWELFETRFKILRSAKKKWNLIVGEFFKESDTFKVYTKSATRLTKFMKSESIDYIYTDPPYGAHITYLDLTKMWDAWLGFEVTKKSRKLEVIEGGDIEHSKEEYLSLLQKSFDEMYKVLKRDSWLSLVFHHKEIKYWYAIRDIADSVGFLYRNTVTQSLSRPTFHKTKNPLKVLGEQLIVNFQKAKKRSYRKPISLPMMEVIKRSAEAEIVQRGGATLEEILSRVVPKLFEAGLILDAASQKMNDILDFLQKHFELGDDGLWHVRKGHKFGSWIPTRNKIRYYVVTILKRKGKADFDEIATKIFELTADNRLPAERDILDVIEEVATSQDKRYWQLKKPENWQYDLQLPEPIDTKRMARVPTGTRHNQMIYRLAVLGQKLGFLVYIGKNERTNEIFKNVSHIGGLPMTGLEATKKKKIEQIDCIWFHKDAQPTFAFEIEDRTGIISALERFSHLLDVHADIGKHRRLIIVAPASKRKKLTQELHSSAYVGKPMYMDNKIRYVFYETFEPAFVTLMRQKKPRLKDVEALLSLP